MASPKGPRSAKTKSARPTSLRAYFIALIVLATVATYWNSLGGPFIWDDQTAIVTNASLHSVWDAWTPPRETPVAGRPLVNLSFALNYAGGGLNVSGYHVVNIAVHLACALLLFALISQTLRDWGRDSQAVALAATLLWAVHPLQSEAVNYITERTESMMGLFFLATLYCAMRGRRAPAHAGRWDAAAVACCALGMACKETMATAPVVVLLYDRSFEFASLRDAVRARRRLYVGLAGTWVVLGALIWSAARTTVGVTSAVGPWTYLMNQAQLVVRYLGLAAWPSALVLDYGLAHALTLADVLPQALLLTAMVIAALVAYIRWPKAGFLAVSFFLLLAPSSSIVPILTEVGAERRMYLPMAALVVLAVTVVWQAATGLTRKSSRRAHAVRTGAAVFAGVIVASLAVRTTIRNQEYASPVTLWRTVVARYPHGRAHYALGTALVAEGRHDEAMSELYQAVSDFPDAKFAIGTELFAAGRVQDARAALEEFIRAQPTRPDRIPAHLLLGHVLIAEKEFDRAEQEFEAIIDARSSPAAAREGLVAIGAAHRELAATLLREQNLEAARAHARQAVRLLPEDSTARNLLGVALASMGNLREAVEEFRRAVELNPKDQQAQDNLARALGAGPPTRPTR